MGGPVWAGWLFVVLLALAGGCLLARVCVLGPSQRHRHGTTDRADDLGHLLMIAGMVGMLSPAGNPLPALVWCALFLAEAGWFGFLVVRRSVAATGRPAHVDHHLHHVLAALAMVGMAAMPTAHSHAMAAGASGVLMMSALSGLLIYFLGCTGWWGYRLVAEGARPSGRSVLAGPRLTGGCQFVMGAGMVYMLVVMCW